MNETYVSANDNLQLLLDRYSLVGKDNELCVDDNGNLEAPHHAPRSGYVYGELTRYGLVHVWADPDKSQFSNAHVLVVDHSFVSTAAHVYDRRKDLHDWTEHTGVMYSVPLVNTGDTLRLETYETITMGKYGAELERAQTHYARVTRALAHFAGLKSRYDGLHQTVAFSNPEVAENLAQLFPYAGQLVGPRVNVQEMILAGVPFHRAVVEAIQRAPELTIE